MIVKLAYLGQSYGDIYYNFFAPKVSLRSKFVFYAGETKYSTLSSPCLAPAWPLSSPCLVPDWLLSGPCLAPDWPLSGPCLVIVWPLSGPCLAPFWLLSSPYLVPV